MGRTRISHPPTMLQHPRLAATLALLLAVITEATPQSCATYSKGSFSGGIDSKQRCRQACQAAGYSKEYNGVLASYKTCEVASDEADQDHVHGLPTSGSSCKCQRRPNSYVDLCDTCPADSGGMSALQITLIVFACLMGLALLGCAGLAVLHCFTNALEEPIRQIRAALLPGEAKETAKTAAKAAADKEMEEGKQTLCPLDNLKTVVPEVRQQELQVAAPGTAAAMLQEGLVKAAH